jgi:uncharacterized protein (DUF1501 family)
MLTVASRFGTRDCSGASRRDFLRVGSLGLAGLTLPWLLRQSAAAKDLRESYIRERSVVLLFLCGGPSQMETFDPNMDAPAPWCSLTGELKTAIPGVTFGGTFPKLASHAKKLAVVRSYAPHGIADHAKAIRHVLTAGDPLKLGSSMGSLAARLIGSNHPQTGAPCYSTLIEDEDDSQYREDMERMRSSSSPGQLGATCAPFASGGESEMSADMQLNLPSEVLHDRRSLVQSFDRLSRHADALSRQDTYDRFGQQAVDVLLGGATRDALDLSKEDPKVVARYDTSHMQTGWLKRRASSIGRQMLTARRLCEAGASFVTVGSAGWDNHGNGNHPGVVEGMHLLGTPLDHAVSAFLEDVEQRGLSDKILLVITGEFGRTPKIQANGGRDHWPGLCPLVFAGGGIQAGQVIGRSSRACDRPTTDPLELDHLSGTIMHSLLDVGQLRLVAGVPRDLLRVIEGLPTIPGLI